MERPDIGSNFKLLIRTSDLDEAQRVKTKSEALGYFTKLLEKQMGTKKIYEVWQDRQLEHPYRKIE